MTRARKAYEKHDLPGPPEKDVVSSRVFKAAGSEIVSSPESLGNGIVSVAAARLPGLSK